VNYSDSSVPVIAIDGPSASGKGTVAQGVAQVLGFHYLDSGAIYRVLGLAALRAGANLESESDLLPILRNIGFHFDADRVLLDAVDVSEAIREEAVSSAASLVSAHAGVRMALLARQREFRQAPGLVADGRDMGSVVFPDAQLKIYLTASAQARAQRRYKQLIGKGLGANMTALLQELNLRDQRDSERAAAPLRQFPDAVEVDTTNLTVAQAIAQVLAHYHAVRDKAQQNKLS
jgi:cytidylate kinase